MASYVRTGGKAAYDAMKHFSETSNDVNLASYARTALAATLDPSLINATIAYAMSSAVRKQDTPYLLRAVGRNPYATTQLLMAYADPSIQQELLKRYGTGGFSLSVLVTALSGLNTETSFEAYTSVFSSDAWAVAGEVVDQTAEMIQRNIQWVQQQQSITCDYLKK